MQRNEARREMKDNEIKGGKRIDGLERGREIGGEKTKKRSLDKLKKMGT